MKKICFNVDQMKSLAKVGFNINTASLCWINTTNYNSSLNTSVNDTFVSINTPGIEKLIGVHEDIGDGTTDIVNSVCPSYSIQDAMELLPYCIKYEGDVFYLDIKRSPTSWIISYDSVEAYTVYQFREESMIKVLYNALSALSTFIVEKPEATKDE